MPAPQGWPFNGSNQQVTRIRSSVVTAESLVLTLERELSQCSYVEVIATNLDYLCEFPKNLIFHPATESPLTFTLEVRSGPSQGQTYYFDLPRSINAMARLPDGAWFWSVLSRQRQAQAEFHDPFQHRDSYSFDAQAASFAILKFRTGRFQP